ncbi:MAG: NAD+ synthase [Candidatus Aenigmarchaeota archaeon]|nr:NAD+ synthase [Candidatus Aenigmarchaeota archaeon]
MDLPNAKRTIIRFIKKQAPNGVVIGLSGGVDSSLVAALCVEALGNEKIMGVIMPSEFTSKEDIEDAKAVAEKLGIDCKTVAIGKVLDELRQTLSADPENSIALANLAPRTRMVILYYYANALKRLVAGTGNRSELLIGYFTKFGDGGVDILPIGDLYKHEVRELAREMGVPEKIVNKTPSAGLWPGQTDEGETGISYDELDKILEKLFDEKKTREDVSKELKTGIEKVNRVLEMHGKSRHKLSLPPVAGVR